MTFYTDDVSWQKLFVGDQCVVESHMLETEDILHAVKDVGPFEYRLLRIGFDEIAFWAGNAERDDADLDAINRAPTLTEILRIVENNPRFHT